MIQVIVKALSQVGTDHGLYSLDKKVLDKKVNKCVYYRITQT